MRFTWRKYPAIDTERETALWEAQHPYAQLLEWREFDPASFSREFMNEPTDDASSMFPFDLIERMVDPTAKFSSSYRRPDLRDEFIVIGYDQPDGQNLTIDEAIQRSGLKESEPPFIDEQSAWRNSDGRPALRSLLAASHTGRYRVLVVAYFSRWSRDAEVSLRIRRERLHDEIDQFIDHAHVQ